jgi:hypothetical protein
MSAEVLPIPQWFWDLIDSSKPDLEKLVSKLETLNREQLENYHGFYASASNAVCEPWEGPYIDGDIKNLSEDSTKDLCDWIVSQGYDYWYSIASLPEEQKEEALRKAFWDEDKVSLGKEAGTLVQWNYNTGNPAYKGYASPSAIAMAIFQTRYKESILEYEEEIYDRIDDLLREGK